MSKKKKILLIVLAVVLVAGGICWRILPDRLTGGTLKLSENILQNFSLRKISEAIGNGSYKYDYKTEPGSWDWIPNCDVYDISTEAYDERVHGSVFIAVPRNPEDAVDEKVIVPLYADWMRHELLPGSDQCIGPSVIIGFQKTQIYQRFASSKQGAFILKQSVTHDKRWVTLRF